MARDEYTGYPREGARRTGMFRRVKALLSTIFERRTKAPTPEQHAFNALVGKFSQIQYLVDQKANLDVIEKAPVRTPSS